jgi:membrane-associated PAP2 superfamily phosphatase
MAAVGGEVVAASYAAAFRLRASCTRLALSAARDVACANLMCARAGGGCACRLAAVLDGLQGARLRSLELARNALPLLPAAVWRREGLVRLDASANALQSLGLDEELAVDARAVAADSGLQAEWSAEFDGLVRLQQPLRVSMELGSFVSVLSLPERTDALLGRVAPDE